MHTEILSRPDAATSLLVAIVFHITAGLFNELFAPHPDTKIIQTVLLLLLAAAVVGKEKKLFFQQTEDRKTEEGKTKEGKTEDKQTAGKHPASKQTAYASPHP